MNNKATRRGTLKKAMEPNAATTFPYVFTLIFYFYYCSFCTHFRTTLGPILVSGVQKRWSLLKTCPARVFFFVSITFLFLVPLKQPPGREVAAYKTCVERYLRCGREREEEDETWLGIIFLRWSIHVWGGLCVHSCHRTHKKTLKIPAWQDNGP